MSISWNLQDCMMHLEDTHGTARRLHGRGHIEYIGAA